jgi:hypothetical protein
MCFGCYGGSGKQLTHIKIRVEVFGDQPQAQIIMENAYAGFGPATPVDSEMRDCNASGGARYQRFIFHVP